MRDGDTCRGFPVSDEAGVSHKVQVPEQSGPKTYGAGTMKDKHDFIAFLSTRLCAKQMAYVLT